MAVYVRVAVFLSVPVSSRVILSMSSGLKISHNIPTKHSCLCPKLFGGKGKVKFTLEKTTKAQKV